MLQIARFDCDCDLWFESRIANHQRFETVWAFSEKFIVLTCCIRNWHCDSEQRLKSQIARFFFFESAIWASRDSDLGEFLRFGLRDFKSLAICDLWFGALSLGMFWQERYVSWTNLEHSRTNNYCRTIVQKCCRSLASGATWRISESRKWGVRSVVVEFGVFGAPRFSVQRSQNPLKIGVRGPLDWKSGRPKNAKFNHDGSDPPFAAFWEISLDSQYLLNQSCVALVLPETPKPQDSPEKVIGCPWTQVKCTIAAKRGCFKRGGFPIWTCPSFFVLFCPFWDFPNFSGIFPICAGMVRGFSRFVLFLFLSLLRAPTRNSPERVRDTIWTFPEKSGKHPGLETPRFSFSQNTQLL